MAGNPAPPYPRRARQRGLEGEVVLWVLVGTDGRPVHVTVARSSGHDLLDHAALQTVRTRWRFDPAARDGRAVEAEILVPVVFRLADSH